jgi:hypothetical protein
MHYRRYRVHSPLFALRDPRLSEQVLAVFGGAGRKPVPTLPPRAPRSKGG